jgi:predicted transcriptional regulator
MREQVKRSTIYLDADLHRALKVKSAETEYTVSELVNEAVRHALAEDAVDLASVEERKNEPLMPFEEVLKRLKKNGKL